MLNEFDYESELPSWISDLSDGLEERIRSLPSKVVEKIRELGVSHWNTVAQGVANSLHNKRFNEDELREILTVSGNSYAGEVSSRDIERVIANARDTKPKKKADSWPALDTKEQRKIVRSSKVKEVSQLAGFYEKEETSQEMILGQLFPKNPLLSIAGSQQEKPKTQRLSEWLDSGLGGKSLIVPSPMKSKTGTTKEGKVSARTLDNTGPRKHLVIEFDKAARDDQAALIHHLAGIAPLEMVVDSGNKSLHAWFRCDSETEDERRRFMAYAVSLGADRSTWTRSQLVRLPGAHRENGNEQTVLVFRPKAAKGDTWRLKKLDKIEEKKSPQKVRHHTEIPFSKKANDFVQGLLPYGGLSVVYAPPGVGKSFWCLDLAACVSSGSEWRGRYVDGGPVVYFCLEGQNGFRGRIEALKRKGKLPDDAPLYVVETPLDFLEPKHVPEFTKAIKDRVGKARLIVVDTLARAMPGANENASEDMGLAIAAAKDLQDATGANVMLVHHSGKDSGKGARGHSSLKGAVDTEIQICESGPMKFAEVTKQKDLESGGTFPFRLVPSSLGQNNRGEEIQTCTVEQLDDSLAPRVGRKREHEPRELLALLPQPTVARWIEAAIATLEISGSTFKRLKRELKEGVDFAKENEEFVSLVVTEKDCF